MQMRKMFLRIYKDSEYIDQFLKKLCKVID